MLTTQRIVVIAMTSKTKLFSTFASDCVDIALVDLYAIVAVHPRAKLVFSVLFYHQLAHVLSPSFQESSLLSSSQDRLDYLHQQGDRAGEI